MRLLSSLLCILVVLMPAGGMAVNYENAASAQVPILLYHRISPVVTDSMTVTIPVFESHMEYLKTNGYKVIPLRQLVDYYLKKGPPLPPKSVVITVDDGHKSVYENMLPLVRKYRVPVTLFIYPSAISNASYAMTWEQLRELRNTGLFDIQSHTFWHPNFKKEHKRLSAAEYTKLVDMQLRKSKTKLETELNTKVDMLAWPFGIYDDDLISKASGAGYTAAFSIERHSAGATDNVMKLPRYLLTNTDRGKAFESIIIKTRQNRQGEMNKK